MFLLPYCFLKINYQLHLNTHTHTRKRILCSAISYVYKNFNNMLFMHRTKLEHCTPNCSVTHFCNLSGFYNELELLSSLKEKSNKNSLKSGSMDLHWFIFSHPRSWLWLRSFPIRGWFSAGWCFWTSSSKFTGHQWLGEASQLLEWVIKMHLSTEHYMWTE